MNLSKNEKAMTIIAGVIMGVIGASLVLFGNPKNMGFCIACFLRDTAGGVGLHRAEVVQYIRPEIIGLIFGSLFAALATKEFSPRGGSAPMTRFVLGFFAMIGALMFLGCPFRMILRIAGGDLNAMKARIDAGIRGTRAVCRVGAETNLRLLNVKKPVIAWIEGAITGAGISLALSCDFQIISETSKCAFSFVNIGFVPDSGAACLVTRAVGTTRAKDLFMSGRFFSGKDAADWGLFTEAVPAEELEERVMKYVKKYSSGPSVAYAGIKTVINRAQFAAYADAMQAEIDAQGECELTEDFPEAVTAFLEKRRPQFKGK